MSRAILKYTLYDTDTQVMLYSGKYRSNHSCATDKSDNGTAQVIQLSNGCVEECKSKTHPHYLKLSTQSTGPEKSIFLSFDTFTDYSKWLKKCRKVMKSLSFVKFDKKIAYNFSHSWII